MSFAAIAALLVVATVAPSYVIVRVEARYSVVPTDSEKVVNAMVVEVDQVHRRPVAG